MKSLNTLIKLHKKNLDSIISQKKKFDDRKDELEEYKRILAARVKEEIKEYYGSEYAYMLDQYLAESRRQKEQIDQELVLLNERIKFLQDKLAEEFSELKKFEVAKENRIAAEKEKEKKMETDTLDEYTTAKFARKKVD